VLLLSAASDRPNATGESRFCCGASTGGRMRRGPSPTPSATSSSPLAFRPESHPPSRRGLRTSAGRANCSRRPRPSTSRAPALATTPSADRIVSPLESAFANEKAYPQGTTLRISREWGYPLDSGSHYM